MTPANASTALATVVVDELVRCGVQRRRAGAGLAQRGARLRGATPTPERRPRCTPASTSGRPASSRWASRAPATARSPSSRPAARRSPTCTRPCSRRPTPGCRWCCSPPTGRRGCGAPTPTRPPTRRASSAARCGCTPTCPRPIPAAARPSGARSSAGGRWSRGGGRRARAGSARPPGRCTSTCSSRSRWCPRPATAGAAALDGAPHGGPWMTPRRPAASAADPDQPRPRTVVVAGDDAGPPARVLAEAAGWPLLAEPTSGSRTGDSAIRTYRLLLADPELAGRIQQVVVFGHPTLSPPGRGGCWPATTSRWSPCAARPAGPTPGTRCTRRRPVELEGSRSWFASERQSAAGSVRRPVAAGVARPRRRRLPPARRAARRAAGAHAAPGRRRGQRRAARGRAAVRRAPPTRCATST